MGRDIGTAQRGDTIAYNKVVRRGDKLVIEQVRAQVVSIVFNTLKVRLKNVDKVQEWPYSNYIVVGRVFYED